jgi:putative endonuclease
MRADRRNFVLWEIGTNRAHLVGPRPLASSAVTERRLRTGRAAEELVAKRLTARGWQLLARNARTRYGELDIVALDAQALVFIEVKAGVRGSSRGPERPVLAVGREKQRRLRRLAGAWLGQAGRLPAHRRLRFDAVGVTYDRAGALVAYEHVSDAF